eukprot:6074975-Amphidinium_carterae.1
MRAHLRPPVIMRCSDWIAAKVRLAERALGAGEYVRIGSPLSTAAGVYGRKRNARRRSNKRPTVSLLDSTSMISQNRKTVARRTTRASAAAPAKSPSIACQGTRRRRHRVAHAAPPRG